MRRLPSIAFLGAWLTAGAATAQLPPPGIEVGQRFPSVVFRDVASDRTLSIDDFRGEKVLVTIFASW